MALPWAAPIVSITKFVFYNSEKKTLVEFRAGRMLFDGKIVKPDAEKGMIQLTLCNGVRTLVWRSRKTGIIEEVAKRIFLL